ncbi:ATP-dependent rRNA helicase SPB4 [Pestalotiopsis fici W106-1]|uniref:ATP-dependent RNA helicase n=1 Tax=Pestalotiopsis fici (strain W106-1 / CGMCC3.15140) TaxID=1229662 RepID=W3WZW5_PESFW|nr:ATP-dependent rRNA helicase SPB4 [Pestalotiopsis fici W106-1]ETS79390.1 ATP-dependent rRNA helicase SPB4 [Pestalotiopsis fici W106-1]
MGPETKATKKETKKDTRAWDALTPPLAEWILDYLSSSGFERMTPVQAAVLPLFSASKDVVVEAVTGSGKTLSYLIPVINRLLRLEEPTKPRHVAAIIVSPTRELASQIHKVLVDLVKFHPTSAELLPYLDGDEKRPITSTPFILPQLLVGGTTTPAQDLSFFLRHCPNILVASPGRLVELLQSPHVSCNQSSFEVLVLDEADRLLDLGFKQDLQNILSRLPKQRRTGLFSASVSDAVSEIIRVGLRNPVKIQVKVKSLKTGGVIEERRTPASLSMKYQLTPASQKLPALAQILEKLDPRPQKSIIFFSTCAAVDYFQHLLPALLPEGYACVPLHGKHHSTVRQKNFNKFLSSAQPTILLTTDLAARGLDVPQVDLVVQIDPPSDPKVYLHRCGRAGRAGRKGLSVLFLQPGREEDYVPFLEIRKTPIEPLTYPEITLNESDGAEATEKIRDLVKEDRGLHEKGQRAFVSWVRSYSSHTASSIFRVADLNWADLAQGWGLLRLPRMPEAKTFEGDRSLGIEMDWDNFAFKDKAREKQRRIDMEKAADPANGEKAEAIKAKRKRNTEAWSDKHEKEGVRSVRREKRQKKREAERVSTLTEDEKVRERELEDMLAQIRKQNQEKLAAAAAKGDDEFKGFD